MTQAQVWNVVEHLIVVFVTSGAIALLQLGLGQNWGIYNAIVIPVASSLVNLLTQFLKGETVTI